MVQTSDLIDSGSVGELNWRCRRCLLGSDVFVERFFSVFVETGRPAVTSSKRGTEFSDNDLPDLLLACQTPVPVNAGLGRGQVREVLCMLNETLERQRNEIS